MPCKQLFENFVELLSVFIFILKTDFLNFQACGVCSYFNSKYLSGNGHLSVFSASDTYINKQQGAIEVFTLARL